jgi:hypothetical protein
MMAGIYGSHPEDRARERELHAYLDKDAQADKRKELIEAVWNSFTDKSGNAQAQALLNRVKAAGKGVFNAIQSRLPPGATPATHNFIATNEEKVRLNSLFGNVGMVCAKVEAQKLRDMLAKINFFMNNYLF